MTRTLRATSETDDKGIDSGMEPVKSNCKNYAKLGEAGEKYWNFSRHRLMANRRGYAKQTVIKARERFVALN